MNTGKGSYVEAVIPWVVENEGYGTKVKGQLMLVDATTSMTFRSLFKCETFEVRNEMYLSTYGTGLCSENTVIFFVALWNYSPFVHKGK